MRVVPKIRLQKKYSSRHLQVKIIVKDKAVVAVNKALIETRIPLICSYDYVRKRKCQQSAREYTKISMRPSRNSSTSTMKKNRRNSIIQFKRTVIATNLWETLKRSISNRKNDLDPYQKWTTRILPGCWSMRRRIILMRHCKVSSNSNNYPSNDMNESIIINILKHHFLNKWSVLSLT